MNRSSFHSARWSMVAILTMAFVVGCGKREPSVQQPLPLASVNGVAITQDEYDFEVQRRAEAGRPLEDPQAVLNDLIQRQAMLQKAETSDVMQDPEVRREMDNRRLGQWLDRTLHKEREAVRVTDEELRAYYEAEQDSFKRSEMVRLAVLYRRVNPHDPEEKTVSLREELARGRSEFLADPAKVTQQGRIPGFGTVAVDYSEDTVSRYRGGDLGWLSVSAANDRLPASVMEAGLGLEVGGVSDVMSGEDGLYVVMKIDRRPSQVTPYEEVAPGLRRHLIRQKQDAVESAFMSNLMADAQIEINEEKAALLTLPVPPAPREMALQSVEQMNPMREGRTR